jgi:NH3-dependent NAD+ synthetase
MAMSNVKKKAVKRTESNKVVLAYSGGLDTSVILKWLQDTYNCEVVTFTADLGQGEELEPARAKALKMGIKPRNIFIDDLREEFVRDFVFPMFRCNTVYEGEYLLGTSIARPLIAKRLVEIAKKTGANSISHGATGKGNGRLALFHGRQPAAHFLRRAASRKSRRRGRGIHVALDRVAGEGAGQGRVPRSRIQEG